MSKFTKLEKAIQIGFYKPINGRDEAVKDSKGKIINEGDVCSFITGITLERTLPSIKLDGYSIIKVIDYGKGKDGGKEIDTKKMVNEILVIKEENK